MMPSIQAVAEDEEEEQVSSMGETLVPQPPEEAEIAIGRSLLLVVVSGGNKGRPENPQTAGA